MVYKYVYIDYCIQSSLVNPAQSVPSKKNPDYQFRIDEGITKDYKNPFQTKVDSGLIKVFRTNQGTDYRGMTVDDLRQTKNKLTTRWQSRTSP